MGLFTTTPIPRMMTCRSNDEWREEAMAREYFCANHSLIASLEPFTDEEIGRIFMAALEYSANGKEPNFVGNERFIWATIKGMIDRDIRAYENKCATNRENGKAGGRPKSEKSDRFPDNRPQPTETEKTQNDKRKEIEKEKENKTFREYKKFTPPTLEEVREYCRQRNSPVDAKKFWEYFNEGRWKDAKGNSVRNWKQKLLTWERYADKSEGKAGQQNGTTSFDTEDFFEKALERSYGGKP